MASGQVTRYDERGVFASKSGVLKSVAKLPKGLFPGAFCRIFKDLAGSLAHCSILHPDGPGTKIAIAYIMWKLTGDLKWFRRAVRDSMVMNLDDLFAVGARGPFQVSFLIDRNKALITDEVVDVMIDETEVYSKFVTSLGIECEFVSGETADVGDLSRTLNINHFFATRMERKDVIDLSSVTAPAFIVGFSSTGKAKWEEYENSGISANGLTNARHDLLKSAYKESFPETYCPETKPDLVYCGPMSLDDRLLEDQRFSIGEALTSPARLYAPLVGKILDTVPREKILGFVNCTGSGQKKIGNFGPRDVQYVIHNPFPLPAIYQALQRVRGNPPLRGLYEVYSCGWRYQAIVLGADATLECLESAKSCGIKAMQVGSVAPNPEGSGKGRVQIKLNGKLEAYDFE